MSQIPEGAGLVVLLRLPEKGKVKTRLAAAVGKDAALEIYNRLVSITLDLVIGSGIPTYLFYDGGLPSEALRDNTLSYHLQSDGDLGMKMNEALTFVLAHHPKAVIIGSDCPGLSRELLYESFGLLDEKDIVLGPTDDGGYYLLGCKKIHPALFDRIEWSTPFVLNQTLSKMALENLSYSLMEQLPDIDTADDWMRYIGK